MTVRARQLIAGLLVACALLPGAVRAEGRKLIAVLEFKDKLDAGEHKQFGLSDAGYFCDEVRQAVPRLGGGFDVITRENVEAILSARGKTLEQCEGVCETKTGELLGADYVVAGDLRRLGTKLKLGMRLFDTRTSRLLRGVTAEGRTFEELDGAFHGSIPELLSVLAPERAAAQAPAAPAARDPGASGEDRDSLIDIFGHRAPDENAKSAKGSRRRKTATAASGPAPDAPASPPPAPSAAPANAAAPAHASGKPAAPAPKADGRESVPAGIVEVQRWPCQLVVAAGANRKIELDAPVAIFDQTGFQLDAGNVDKVFSSLSIVVPIGGNCELLAESARSVRIDPR